MTKYLDIADRLYRINAWISIQTISTAKKTSVDVESLRAINKELGNIIKELRNNHENSLQ